jgi:hypothetical protein
MVFAS